MDSVAAEISQKVGVLFEDGDRYTGPREQQSQHRTGRSAPGNNAADLVGHTMVTSCSRGIISAHTTYSIAASGPVPASYGISRSLAVRLCGTDDHGDLDAPEGNGKGPEK